MTVIIHHYTVVARLLVATVAVDRQDHQGFVASYPLHRARSATV